MTVPLNAVNAEEVALAQLIGFVASLQDGQRNGWSICSAVIEDRVFRECPHKHWAFVDAVACALELNRSRPVVFVVRRRGLIRDVLSDAAVAAALSRCARMEQLVHWVEQRAVGFLESDGIVHFADGSKAWLGGGDDAGA